MTYSQTWAVLRDLIPGDFCLEVRAWADGPSIEPRIEWEAWLPSHKRHVRGSTPEELLAAARAVLLRPVTSLAEVDAR